MKYQFCTFFAASHSNGSVVNSHSRVLEWVGSGGGGEPDLFGAGIPRSVSRAARFLENCLVDLRFSN